MCLHTNEASIRLHEKLGFIEEGRIRRNSFQNGQYLDDVLFGMTREEFDEHVNDHRDKPGGL
jgi:RimJ/RimL family protein N-acetyltransferase